MVEEIRETTPIRDEAYRKAQYEDTELNWLHYKRKRNSVKLIKVKKKKYYENMIDHNKGNPTVM